MNLLAATTDLLPGPLQWGVLGVLFVTLTGIFALLREIISRRDAEVSAVRKEQSDERERVLQVLSDAAVAQVKLADLGQKMLEQTAIARERNRDPGHSGRP
jgi:hypothetical protein